jgi:xanthine dehydrogenase accessory factor
MEPGVMSWLDTLAEEIGRDGAIVRVTVIRADGSTPREVGAAMHVTAGTLHGTIGGGALELAAIDHARSMLVREGEGRTCLWQRDVRDLPLGPSLGQCCGGYVRLLFEVFAQAEREHLIALAKLRADGGALLLRPLAGGTPLAAAADRKEHRPEWPLAVTRAVREMLSGARPREPLLVRGAKGATAWFVEPCARRGHRLYLYLYGAGHVGRALVRVLQDLPFAIAWVDTSAARFPESIPTHSKPQIAPDPAAFAAAAPAGAFHLVLTYSHALDLAICHSLLRRGDFQFLGLIGSSTKRARFVKRLSDLGIPEARLARLVCPIGLPGLAGKEPAMIAVSVAAQLLQLAAAAERNTHGRVPRAEDRTS